MYTHSNYTRLARTHSLKTKASTQHTTLLSTSELRFLIVHTFNKTKQESTLPAAYVMVHTLDRHGSSGRSRPATADMHISTYAHTYYCVWRHSNFEHSYNFSSDIAQHTKLSSVLTQLVNLYGGINCTKERALLTFIA